MIMDTDYRHDSRIPLVLGTAQLGMDYGIANKTGKPRLKEAVEIIKTAFEGGIKFFDTAQVYGDSEEILGKCFKELRILQGNGPIAVISKISPDIKLSDTDNVFRMVDESLNRLGVKYLWGLMLHRESLLEQGKQFLRHIVLKLKSENKVKNFGASVYSPEKAFEALNMDEIDIVQVPFNVFDQRALDYGVFRLAEKKKKKVFVRSLYLQGLLLLDKNNIPDQVAFLREELEKYVSFTRDYEISPKLLALAFVIQKAGDAMLVIGADNSNQVKENIFLLEKAKEVDLPDLSFLSTNDPKLINPSLWPKLFCQNTLCSL